MKHVMDLIKSLQFLEQQDSSSQRAHLPPVLHRSALQGRPVVATLNRHPAMEIQVVSHGLVPAPCRKHGQTEPCSLPPHSHPTSSFLHPCQPAANPTMALCGALSSQTTDAVQSLCGRNVLLQHGSTRRVVDDHPGLPCTEHPLTPRDGKCHALGKEMHQIPSLFQIIPCCLWSAVTACTAVDDQTSSLPPMATVAQSPNLPEGCELPPPPSVAHFPV